MKEKDMKLNIVTAFYAIGSLCFLFGTIVNRFMQ